MRTNIFLAKVNFQSALGKHKFTFPLYQVEEKGNKIPILPAAVTFC